MRTKRRKRKYTWFPVTGSAGPAETNDNFAQLLAQHVVSPDGLTNVDISPCVPDVPMEGDDINVTAPGQLVQALGQEYFIERIVGKCFLSYTTGVDDGIVSIFPRTVLVACGFFVARANDGDVGGGAGTPIGSASLPERVENYSPLSEDAIREPWIWRRTWILSNGRPVPNPNSAGAFGLTTTQISGGVGFTNSVVQAGAPTTNINQGSALDGPHFDAKSVRRVGNDERLWFVVASRTLDREFDITTPNVAGILGLVLDYRVLGRLTRAHNRSNF